MRRWPMWFVHLRRVFSYGVKMDNVLTCLYIMNFANRDSFVSLQHYLRKRDDASCF
jgi:hypothetical protein